MAKKRLGLLHTSATLVPIFEQLCKAKLPGVAVFNLVDDSLIKDVINRGDLTAAGVDITSCIRGPSGSVAMT